MFSTAAYVRFRAAAWAAFDADLRSNGDALENEFREEVQEAREWAARPGGGAATDPLRRAANEALAAFRLNGLSAEIRSGEAADTLLARTSGADGDQSALGGAAWARLARGPAGRVFALSDGRRAVARRLRVEGSDDTVTMLIAGSTELVEETLAAIRRSVVEFGVAGLLLALAGGYWLASRALRPIDLLTRQAAALAETASPAGARLAIPNPDDELGRLGLTLNRLLERIEESGNQNRAFIADAAHELKTPVAIVRAEAELSLSGERSLVESRASLAAIAAESAHLSRLVSDLTLLAEGATLEHPLERRLVDMAELLQDVARSLRAIAAARQVALDFEVSGDLEYRGDERLLRQVVVNLVENAIKFSRPGSRVLATLSRAGSTVELTVADGAPTLPERDRARVFERFYRSPQAGKGEVGGSGLGLAIVDWAVKLHGGQVRVEPGRPEGNRFVVTLPLGAEPVRS